MKYSALFGLAALALGFVACDEIEESTGLPQTNPQLPILTVDNVPLTPAAAAQQGINLIQANDNGGTINLATIETPADFPEGYRAEVLSVELGKDAAFTEKQAIQAVTDAEGNVTVQADDWETAHQALFGKNPGTTTTYIRIPAWAVKGDQTIRLGNENAYYSTFSTQVTPFDLFDGYVIEDAYYLVGSFCDWDFSKALKFSHNEYDPYDDPTFTLKVPAFTPDWEWVIIPESTHAAGHFVDAPQSSFGVEFSNSLKGALVINDTQDYGTPGVITENVGMLFKVNMLDLTYEIEELPSVLYTPGNSNGWNFDNSQQLVSYETGKYRGFVYINGIFKFTDAPNWDGTNYGNSGTDGVLSTDGGAGNLELPAQGEGLYFADVNTNDLTYTLTYISAVNIPGGFNGWDINSTMTSADYLHWTVVADLQGGEFKFAFNNSWDLSYGGAADDLQYNGPNCKAPEGTYLVTLDLTSVPYTYTLTAQ